MTKAGARLKPFLKWAGGKRQLIPELSGLMPDNFGRYIEPFIGGGALFFHVAKPGSIISDINPELINCYQQVACNVDGLIEELKHYQNTKDEYYRVRSLDWKALTSLNAAARFIYLNHTCYNGLYRVNRKGEFNVPFGNYKNPTICNEAALRAASELLGQCTIVCGEFDKVLAKYAREGDFVFLDPPYVPISQTADFKRYNREQFYEDDQARVAKEYHKLVSQGCNVLLTNSNAPLVHKLYADYPRTIVRTRRYISSNANTRKGQDLIIHSKDTSTSSSELADQVSLYPQTRYMGSKRKLLTPIWSLAQRFEPKTILDLFSGSGIVSYMFKCQGAKVVSNDYMAMSSTYTKALVENDSVQLSAEKVHSLLKPSCRSDGFVASTFKGLYYTDDENALIDNVRANIADLPDPYERAIAMTALIRACMKKRPRGIFTYVGNRYNDGRKDLQMSLEDQFIDAVEQVNRAVFTNGHSNLSIRKDALNIEKGAYDLVYIDPPYYSPYSDNEYVRRYHFVEGLACDWTGVAIQEETKTKKFKSYPTPFSSRNGAYNAFNTLFERFADSVILVSYSSNSLPTLEEMVELISRYKKHVEVVPVDHTYSFGTQRKNASGIRNNVKEYLFLGY